MVKIMSKDYTIQEVEHENLILAQDLISMYKAKIQELETEIISLRSQLTSVPMPINPIPQKRRIVTISGLREVLETRSANSIKEGPVHEKV
jgi:hypothetical protein